MKKINYGHYIEAIGNNAESAFGVQKIVGDEIIKIADNVPRAGLDHVVSTYLADEIKAGKTLYRVDRENHTITVLDPWNDKIASEPNGQPPCGIFESHGRATQFLAGGHVLAKN